MALFEQIGKKIMDKSQNASQQMKTMNDVSRLNDTILARERQIKQVYSEIGRNYYKNHKDDPQAEERPWILKIDALQAEIQDCKAAIDRIRGIVRCPRCGAEVPLTMAFCGNCGASIASEKEKGPQTCPNCHQAIQEGSAFCSSCGTKLS